MDAEELTWDKGKRLRCFDLVACKECAVVGTGFEARAPAESQSNDGYASPSTASDEQSAVHDAMHEGVVGSGLLSKGQVGRALLIVKI